MGLSLSLSIKRRSRENLVDASLAAYSLVGLDDQQTLRGPAPTWRGGESWTTVESHEPPQCIGSTMILVEILVHGQLVH